MGKILQLDEHLSNMIAAGEVVEKPSSVIKELVENAIDAGATQISVSLVDSGIKEMVVLDNGSGMSKEDALLCFSRHATSKIKNEYDLFRIQTLGFRGEAIPSIASVSSFELKTNDGVESTKVLYKAGKFISCEPCALNKGTQIKVSNLFYNVPARLKYLRSLSQELSSISYLMARFILANPNISFMLSNNQKVIYKTSGNGDLTQIFGELYGLEVARNLLKDSFEGEGYKASITVCNSLQTRSNKLELTTVVNGRFVKSNIFNDAIISAFKTYIPEGRYPISLLNLSIDPLLIDVNVHPSKMTIKISSETEIASIITSLVRGMLEKATLIPDAIVDTNIKYKKDNIFDELDSINEEMKNASTKNNQTFFESKEIYNEPLAKENEVKELNNENLNKDNNELKESNNDSFSLSQLLEDGPTFKKEEKKQYDPNFLPHEKTTDSLKLPLLKYVGSVHGTYLVFESPDGLYLMDQHAAAERINYEYYLEVLKNPKNERTDLIVPLNIELTKNEMIFVESNLNLFESFGFLLEQSGSSSYFIRQIPVWVHFDDAVDFLRNLIYTYKENKSASIMEYRDRISKQIACKSSIKANHQITANEANALIDGLNKCKNPFTCPHGRPTIVKFSILDLEKMFKRVM